MLPVGGGHWIEPNNNINIVTISLGRNDQHHQTCGNLMPNCVLYAVQVTVQSVQIQL